MATIITKNSSTAGAVPIAGDLVQGEIAVNVTDKKLYTKNASGSVVQITPTVNDNGFKNRIINGAMMIDQRNAGASVTISSNSAVTYTADRWLAYGTTVSKFSVQQNAGAVTPPVGYTSYLGVTSLSAYSVLASDYFVLGQRIEGFNTSDLNWGTANAQTVTLSFWVRSSLTGTFGGTIQNGGAARSYPFSYTINAANTWEQKSVTVSGDTSGTWLVTNGTGMNVLFGLGVGSTYSGTANTWATANYNAPTGATSVVGTNGATFYITGVQLEKGSTATSFDYRPYGTELALCQRYCVVWGTADAHLGMGTAYSSTAMNITVPIPVPMRTTPTPSKVTTGGNWLQTYVGASGTNSNSTPEVGEASVSAYRIYTPSSGSGWTAGQTTSWCRVLSGATFTLSAEL